MISPASVAVANIVPKRLSANWLAIPAMVLLFGAAGLLQAITLSSLSSIENADIWWHLRTGTWVLQNHTLPHTGLFSQSADLSWTAPSWGYEVLLACAYKLFGLAAIAGLAVCFKVALGVATFVLAGGLRGRFWSAMVLSGVVQYVLGSVQPGPGYFSILLFGVELALLFNVHRNEQLQRLYWLPVVFLVWANLDTQFVYGVALLLIFALGTVFSGGAQFDKVSRPQFAGAVAISLFASLITPHYYKPYAVFFQSVTSAANAYFPEFHAMSFHRPEDYVLLLLTMAAFLCLGMRRSHDLLQIALLIACAALSFHSQRDAWLVALAAIAIMGDSEVTTIDKQTMKNCFVVGVVALAVSLVIVAKTAGKEALLARVSRTYPVAAGDYIRKHRLSQPFFNAAEWGGFLTWYLPEYPVAIDGRRNLYSDDFLIQYAKVMNADVPYVTFPALADARTILLPKSSLMGQALATLPQLRVAYSDSVAVVLVRRD